VSGRSRLIILLGIQLSDFSLPDIIDDPMNLETPSRHGIKDGMVLLESLHPLQHTQLDEFESCLFGFQRLQQLNVVFPQRSQGEQPGVNQSQSGVPQSCCHTSTAGVPTEHHMLDFEMHDGIIDDGVDAEVVGMHDICNVPVHEDLAWFQTKDGGFRASGVGASNPEDFGRLAACKFREQVGLCRRRLRGPFFVRGDCGFELVCRSKVSSGPGDTWGIPYRNG
jgi:hypothetical protein